MKELEIDISGHRSKNVDEFAGQTFDCVLTVCDHARETCSVFFAAGSGAAVKRHRSFEDPPRPGLGSEEERMAVFRHVRDELRAYRRPTDDSYPATLRAKILARVARLF